MLAPRGSFSNGRSTARAGVLIQQPRFCNQIIPYRSASPQDIRSPVAHIRSKSLRYASVPSSVIPRVMTYFSTVAMYDVVDYILYPMPSSCSTFRFTIYHEVAHAISDCELFPLCVFPELFALLRATDSTCSLFLAPFAARRSSMTCLCNKPGNGLPVFAI